MSTVAVMGAGDLGGAIAHALAVRGHVRRLVIVDEAFDVAAGKALDLRQSGPIDRVDVTITAARDVLDAVGARVIVIADTVGTGVWDGERGLALLARFVRAGAKGAIVCAAPTQIPLMERVVREAGVAPNAIVGTSASAVVAAARTLVGLELDRSGRDVQIVVTGRPPGFVVGWSAATAGGALVSERVPAHRLIAITNALKQFWPPGPRAIGAATAPIVEALIDGSRHAHQAATILDGEFGVRGVAGVLPLSLGNGRVLSRQIPSLTPQERTELVNSLATK